MESAPSLPTQRTMPFVSDFVGGEPKANRDFVTSYATPTAAVPGGSPHAEVGSEDGTTGAGAGGSGWLGDGPGDGGVGAHTDGAGGAVGSVVVVPPHAAAKTSAQQAMPRAPMSRMRARNAARVPREKHARFRGIANDHHGSEITRDGLVTAPGS